MLPEITVHNIRLVNFPVYPLRTDDIVVTDKLIFANGRIVDNANLPGDTIGIRRLKIPKLKRYQLTKTIPDYISLIKSKERHFIDNKGKPFSYRKTRYAEIRSLKLENISKLDVYSVLKFEGLNFTFVVNRPPPAFCPWASVAFYEGRPFELFDYTETRQETIKRKF